MKSLFTVKFACDYVLKRFKQQMLTNWYFLKGKCLLGIKVLHVGTEYYDYVRVQTGLVQVLYVIRHHTTDAKSFGQ